MPDRKIIDIVTLTLKNQKVHSAYIELAIAGDKYMQNLTETYTAKRYNTDVLAFDLSEPKDDSLYAQIIVNAPLARRKAKIARISGSAELAMYIIHGLLHLRGFDDHNPDDAKKMHRKTFELLKKAGFKKLPPMPLIDSNRQA